MKLNDFLRANNSFTKKIKGSDELYQCFLDLEKYESISFSNDICIITIFAKLKTYLITSEYEKKLFIKLCEEVFKMPKRKVLNFLNIAENIVLKNYIDFAKYRYSQLVEMLPLANSEYNEYLKKINPDMTCRQIRSFVHKITKKEEEEILHQEEAEGFDVSKFDLRNAFSKTIETFQYAKQDVRVVVNYIAELLNINIEKLFKN